MKIQSVEGDIDLVSESVLHLDVLARHRTMVEAGQQVNDFCPADGVFIAMGTAGSTGDCPSMGAELTEKGNIKVNENMETTILDSMQVTVQVGFSFQVAKAVYEGAQAVFMQESM